MVAQAIFSCFPLVFTFYESWTSVIACIHAFYTVGNIYIEAISFLVAVFRCSSIIPCPFRLLHHFKLSVSI